MTTHGKGLLCGLIPTLIWGSYYPLGRFFFAAAGETFHPVQIMFLRMLCACLFLLLVMAARGRLSELGRLLYRHGRLIILLAITGVALEPLLQFWSLKYTTAARAGLLANTSPVFTLLLAAMLGQESLNRRKSLGLVLGAAGTAAAFAAPGSDLYSGSLNMLPGDAMALLGALCWAAYTVGGSRLQHHGDGLAASTAAMLTGTLMLFPLYLLLPAPPPVRTFTGPVWGMILYSGIIATGVANALWFAALDHLSPGTLGAFGYLSLLICLLTSGLALHENFSAPFLLALCAILAGTALMLHAPAPDPSSPTETGPKPS